MNASTITLSVPTYRLDNFKKAVNRINNLVSNNLPPVSYKILGNEDKSYDRPVLDSQGFKFYIGNGNVLMETIWINHTNIELESHGIIGFNGWKVLGKLESDKDYPKPLQTAIARDMVMPEFHTNISHNALTCEHCNKRIQSRIYYFSLYNEETNTYKMVGKNCLKEFLGVDPERWLSEFQIILDNGKPEYDDMVSYNANWSYPIINVLLLGMAVIAEDGCYYSKECGDDYIPTVYKVRQLLSSFDGIGIINNTNTPENQAKIDSIINWVSDNTSTSSFIANVKQFFENGKVPEKYIGYVVGILPYYYSAMEKIEKAARNPSSYIGNIKDKITVSVTVKAIIPIQTLYGWVDIVKMLDSEGNVFIWYSSNTFDNTLLNTTISIKGTVKEHKEYHGECQTVLTRCKIL